MRRQFVTEPVAQRIERETADDVRAARAGRCNVLQLRLYGNAGAERSIRSSLDGAP